MTMMLYIYRPRWFQWSSLGVNGPRGCWVTASTRFQECFLRLWARSCGPNGQITMTLHIYRPRQFQWTWPGVNPAIGCRFLVSAKFGLDWWKNGWTDGRRQFYSPPFFLRKGWGTTNEILFLRVSLGSGNGFLSIRWHHEHPFSKLMLIKFYDVIWLY